METKISEHPCVLFLKSLYKNCSRGSINLRFLPSKKVSFIPLKQIDSIASILQNHRHENVYFGVATRRNGDGSKSGIIEIPGIWVDIDLYKLPSIKLEELKRKDKDFILKPTIEVGSGGGYHGYWLLREPATKEHLIKVETVLDRLAAYFMGDEISTDVSRILRLPGTLNYKYNPPKPVILKSIYPEREYNLDDFDFLSQVEVKAKGKPRLPEGWEKGLLEGVSEGERNNTITRLAGRYIGKGLSRKEILPILLNANSRFRPPLNTKEVEACLDSIIKTDQRNHPIMETYDDGGLCHEPIGVGKKEVEAPFQPLSTQELGEILGLTIKRDENNKKITFLCCLSAYTEDSQINLSYNAPSSTGKSYIPIEVSQVFPQEDVILLGYCSPAAFFHDIGVWDKENKRYVIDLSHKILIFLDQPHNELLARLRPLLSHDRKEITLKITDKTQKYGLKTKNILIRGFPAVIFCTAGLKVDEQEATRFLLLSPEASQEKIREAIYQKIKKEADTKDYKEWLNGNFGRNLLKQRIRAIKQENISDVKINSTKQIEEFFLCRNRFLKPRHARDVGRVISLIKSIALLNVWFREREDSTIIATEEDIGEGLRIWETIAETQELNLPPYIYELFQNVILPAWEEKYRESGGGGGVVIGLQRNEVIKKYFRIYKRYLPDWQLRQQIIPVLENSGLITEEPDPNDKRRVLIYPTLQLTISSADAGEGTDYQREQCLDRNDS